MDDIPQIERVLVDRFARGNGTVFVGAGISLPSRLPSWRKLIGPLQDDLGPDAMELDPLQVAELYEVKHGRSALVQYLKEQLGHVKFQLNRTHELLVSLPVNRIYTTNFDDLLEQASHKKQINRNVIYNASHVGLSDTSTLSIIKLHGDLADPNSIVITARDFYSYAAKNPAVSDLLKVELQTRTVLFIGYSFSDPNLAMILGNAVTQAGATPALIYAVQFRPNPFAIQAMRARGVTVIPIDAAAGTAEAEAKLEAWLEQFHRSLKTLERRQQRALDGIAGPVCGRVIGRNYSVRCERTADRIQEALSSGFRVIVVKGEAGVGKTHLVAEAALNKLHSHNHTLWTEAFDQVIWISPLLGEHGGWHSLKQIASVISSQVDLVQASGSFECQQPGMRINAILQERRLLVVIEDFDDPSFDLRLDSSEKAKERIRDYGEVKHWLEHPGIFTHTRSRIIVTSRSASLAGFVVEVGPLDEATAKRMIREHARTIMLKRHFSQLDKTVETRIVELSRGNPQAIKLILGLIKGRSDDAWLDGTINMLGEHRFHRIEFVFDNLATQLWGEVEKIKGARRVVEVMVAFPVDEWMPSMLLKKAARLRDPHYDSIQKCIELGLIGYDAVKDMMYMHRTIKEALLRQHSVKGVRLDRIRTCIAAHILARLRQSDLVCRPEIDEPYWNALVRDEMARIDAFWPLIHGIMWWAREKPIVVDFLLLLVHYMDSRFLNRSRLDFVQQSIAVLGQAPDQARTRALLHIDALGWTFVEEGADAQALAEIDKGISLLGDNDADLRALACTWKARICVNQGKLSESRELIEHAKLHVERCPGMEPNKPSKPWIRARIAMIDGDIKVKEGKPEDALRCYLLAEEHQEQYGGEVGYQIDPRIGLAWLSQADLHPDQAQDAINNATQYFDRLAENANVPTGRLYGQYGQALIDARLKTSTTEARTRLHKTLMEIEARQGENNVLLKLARESCAKLG